MIRHQNPLMGNLVQARCYNLTATTFVKAKFRCPGQGKVKMSALCQKQTLHGKLTMINA